MLFPFFVDLKKKKQLHNYKMTRQLITLSQDSDVQSHLKNENYYKIIKCFISNTYFINYYRSNYVTMWNTMERNLQYKSKNELVGKNK